MQKSKVRSQIAEVRRERANATAAVSTPPVLKGMSKATITDVWLAFLRQARHIKRGNMRGTTQITLHTDRYAELLTVLAESKDSAIPTAAVPKKAAANSTAAESQHAGKWTVEIEYLSAERKATTGRSILRDPQGEYVGKLYDQHAQDIADALNARARDRDRDREKAAVNAMNAPPDPIDEAYRTAAKEQHVSEGTLEIDDGAIVSRSSDGGAYIAAWVWVSDEEAEICRTCRTNSTVDGEGYGGECGECADKTEAKRLEKQDNVRAPR